MKSCLECLRNSKEVRVAGVEKVRLSEMRVLLGLVGHGKKPEFYFEGDRKSWQNSDKTDTIFLCFESINLLWREWTEVVYRWESALLPLIGGLSHFQLVSSA